MQTGNNKSIHPQHKLNILQDLVVRLIVSVSRRANKNIELNNPKLVSVLNKN